MIRDIFFSFSFQASVHLEFTFIRTKGDQNSEILKKKTKKKKLVHDTLRLISFSQNFLSFYMTHWHCMHVLKRHVDRDEQESNQLKPTELNSAKLIFFFGMPCKDFLYMESSIKCQFFLWIFFPLATKKLGGFADLPFLMAFIIHLLICHYIYTVKPV
jgi:hypothetical protein